MIDSQLLLSARKVNKNGKWGLYSTNVRSSSVAISVKRFIFSLLCLFQILSPWVHAHTGGETGVRLHIPGLENLVSHPEGYSARQWDSNADLIVGVQAGFSKRCDATVNKDDTNHSVLNEAVFPNVSTFKPGNDWVQLGPSLHERHPRFESPPSRAPPSFS